MTTAIATDLEKQISCAQDVIGLCSSLKDKFCRLEEEKNIAVKKYQTLKAKFIKIKETKCYKCDILLKALTNERKERAKLLKQEKTNLLKTVLRSLEGSDIGNTSNAQQLLTQLVCDAPEANHYNKKLSLIEENESGDKVHEEETIIISESEDSFRDCSLDPKKATITDPIVIPETEYQCNPKIKERDLNKPNDQSEQGAVISQHDQELNQVVKKPKYSPGNEINKSNHHLQSSLRGSNQQEKSLQDPAMYPGSEKRPTAWKMKPNLVVDKNDAASGKRLKQMTLSLTRPEQKQDISLSAAYKGGLTSDDENDIVLSSPEVFKKVSSRKAIPATLEDPDLTLFQPPITSTCHQLESSFDRLPEPDKSPPYKYRGETVRGKEKRLKLPGQDCDQCAQYYQHFNSSSNNSEDLKLRMNACSRHRNKNPLRVNTPPDFWNPVIPVSPEVSQDTS